MNVLGLWSGTEKGREIKRKEERTGKERKKALNCFSVEAC